MLLHCTAASFSELGKVRPGMEDRLYAGRFWRVPAWEKAHGVLEDLDFIRVVLRC